MARISIRPEDTSVDAIVLSGRYRLGRVQRSDVSVDNPNTPVRELGNDKLAGRMFDLSNVSVTLAAMDASARNEFIIAGKDYDSAVEGDYVTLGDYDYVCLAQSYRGQGTSDDIVKSLFLDGGMPERLSYNYSVGGDANLEFSFQTNNTKWLRHDVCVAQGTISAGALTMSNPEALQLKNGNYYLAAYASGFGYLPSEAFNASAAGSVTFDTTSYPALEGAAATVIYHGDDTNKWMYTREVAAIANDVPGVRGYGIEVYLVQGDFADSAGGMFDTNDRVMRAQTVSIQVSFPITRVQELGTEQYVGSTKDIPDVTGTIEILEHDWKLLAQARGDVGGFSDNDYDPTELTSGDWGLLVKVYDRGADRTASPIKTLYIPKIDFTQEAANAQVSQDNRLTFNWAATEGEMFIYKGAKLA